MMIGLTTEFSGYRLRSVFHLHEKTEASLSLAQKHLQEVLDLLSAETDGSAEWNMENLIRHCAGRIQRHLAERSLSPRLMKLSLREKDDLWVELIVSLSL